MWDILPSPRPLTSHRTRTAYPTTRRPNPHHANSKVITTTPPATLHPNELQHTPCHLIRFGRSQKTVGAHPYCVIQGPTPPGDLGSALTASRADTGRSSILARCG